MLIVDMESIKMVAWRTLCAMSHRRAHKRAAHSEVVLDGLALAHTGPAAVSGQARAPTNW